LRYKSTRNEINERKVRRCFQKERAGQGVVLKDVRPGLSFSQVLSAILVANIVTRLFPAQTPPPNIRFPQALAALKRRGMKLFSFFSNQTAWRTCLGRHPAPPKSKPLGLQHNSDIKSDLCPSTIRRQPNGRSLDFALSLARRFDMSRCSNCFGWMSSLQPPQSRIVLLVHYMSVISNDLIAQLELPKLLSYSSQS